jgi:hypothetical protein
MAEQFDGQRALKIDYSLCKREAYIETVRCLMERRKHDGMDPLGMIGFISPVFPDGSLPSWVPDWSPSAEPNRKHELGGMSFYYNANGLSSPEPIFDMEDGVLIVKRLKIATVEHFGAMPVPSPRQPSFGTVGAWATGSVIDIIDNFQAPEEAFYTAVTLAMSDSEYMLHSVAGFHGPLQKPWIIVVPVPKGIDVFS